jgi:hypothetical protein
MLLLLAWWMRIRIRPTCPHGVASRPRVKGVGQQNRVRWYRASYEAVPDSLSVDKEGLVWPVYDSLAKVIEK